jgi:hypothetical protein
VQLVIEDDAGTVKLLLEAGARSVFDMLHFAGDVPAA